MHTVCAPLSTGTLCAANERCGISGECEAIADFVDFTEICNAQDAGHTATPTTGSPTTATPTTASPTTASPTTALPTTASVTIDPIILDCGALKSLYESNGCGQCGNPPDHAFDGTSCAAVKAAYRSQDREPRCSCGPRL